MMLPSVASYNGVFMKTGVHFNGFNNRSVLGIIMGVACCISIISGSKRTEGRRFMHFKTARLSVIQDESRKWSKEVAQKLMIGDTPPLGLILMNDWSCSTIQVRKIQQKPRWQSPWPIVFPTLTKSVPTASIHGSWRVDRNRNQC